MTEEIPPILYRGDQDSGNVRYLRDQARFGHLFTNLINNGDPFAIFTHNLTQLIKQHISPGWRTTHFLSFTSKERKALQYGLSIKEEDYPDLKLLEQKIDKELTRYWDIPNAPKNWDFIIIKLNNNYIKYKETTLPGIYSGQYSTNKGEHEILLINAQKILLQTQPKAQEAYKNAKRDEEWLVLPLDSLPKPEQGFSAIFTLPSLDMITYYTETNRLKTPCIY